MSCVYQCSKSRLYSHSEDIRKPIIAGEGERKIKSDKETKVGGTFWVAL